MGGGKRERERERERDPRAATDANETQAGGLEQRQLLTAEGVIFKAEGLQAKVVPGTFWDPSDDEIDLVLEADENI